MPNGTTGASGTCKVAGFLEVPIFLIGTLVKSRPERPSKRGYSYSDLPGHRHAVYYRQDPTGT
jgi:hypothetical protein